MRRYFSLASVCGAFLVLVCLPALADSHDNFSNETLTGNSGSKLSGSFTFNSTTDTFSNLSLSFMGGAFNGVNASDVSGGKATCFLGLCTFAWEAQVGNVLILDTIVLNLKTGAYQDIGSISNYQNQGLWNFDPPMTAPEGASSLAYLTLSGLAILAGILISEKKRRKTPTAHSV